MIRFIRTLIKPKQTVSLGRWQLNYSEEILAQTIKLANEDHCGTCVNPPKAPKPTQKKRS